MCYVPNAANDILEADFICQVLIEKLGTPSNPARYYIRGAVIQSDYSSPVLQSMSFPTLFLYGFGDVTRDSRRVSVKITESNKHLLHYTVAVPSINPHMYLYPFAINGRGMHWDWNNAECRRTQG